MEINRLFQSGDQKGQTSGTDQIKCPNSSRLCLENATDAAIVDFYRSKCELVLPATVPAGACRDPDDLPVFGTCLSGRAECLVTGDKDLLDLARFEDVEILSPREFFDRYNQEDDEAR